MKLNRLLAINLRYFYLLRRSYDRLVDVFYWPALDLFIWGLTSSFFTTLNPSYPNILLILVFGQIFWIIVWRGQYEITVNLLEDLWNKNLINVFVSPIKFSEWITALIIHGILKAMLSFSFAVGFSFLLYHANVFKLGFHILPFVILLIMTGWSVGFFVAGLILRYGTKVQTLAWTFGWLIGPFSAIYYPVAVLPKWAQAIASVVPASYVFEGIRKVIDTGKIDMQGLMICLVLNIVYLVITFLFLRRSFYKVLEQGLVKVY